MGNAHGSPHAEWSTPATEEVQTEWADPIEEAAPAAEWASTSAPAASQWDAPADNAPAAAEWSATSHDTSATWDAPATTEWSSEQTANWNEAPAEEVSLADTATPASAEWNDASVDVEPVMEEAEPIEAASAWEAEPILDSAPVTSQWAAASTDSPFGAQAQDFTEATPIEEEVSMELEQEVAEIDVEEEAVVPPPAPMAAIPVVAPAPAHFAQAASLATAAQAQHAAVVMPAAPASHVAVEREPLFDDTAIVGGTALTSFVEGEHRVIIHTVEGQVKRGTIRDADLLDEVISLEQQSGFAAEQIPGKRVKAIFFMLAAGARQPQVEGQKIRVTFNDGRQVAGFSQDFQGSTPGFFVIPADQRTNTARIFIYRSSVQAVAEG